MKAARQAAGGDPVPDTNASIDFLRTFAPEGPWGLLAIHPILREGRNTRWDSYDADNEEAVRRWIDAYQGEWNIYYGINSVAGRPTKKPKRCDVAQAEWLFVDVDPSAGGDLATEQARILAALEAYEIPPTAIVFTGGGYQALWKLESPVPLSGDQAAIDRVQAHNKGLISALGADTACFNVDRVFRLPGTINVPNATKIAKGRTRALARCISFDASRIYPLSAFRPVGTAGGHRMGPQQERAGASYPSIEALLSELPAGTRLLVTHGKDPDDPNRYQSRSEPLFRVCCELARLCSDDELIRAVIANPDFAISASVLDNSNPTKYAERQIARARSAVQRELPIIRLAIGELPRVLDEAEAALIRAGTCIYQRSGELVRVCRLDDDASDDAPGSGVLTLRAVSDHWLREHWMTVARWERANAKGDWVAAEPALREARHYLERVGNWGLPVLDGVVETPTLRADGTVLANPGYDRASRLLLSTGGVAFPPMLDQPSEADAKAALGRLIRPLRGFPFLPDEVPAEWTPGLTGGMNPSSSRSVALSAILTGVIRRTLSTAPMHAFDAAEMGTGKSLLAEIISLLATGQSLVPVSQGKDPVEDEKKLFAALRRGPSLVAIDNIERPIEGDALCTILTQQYWGLRVLGFSENQAVRTNCLFIATGNNLIFQGDMARRAIVCRLDARSEHPDQRKFDFNPLNEVRENRAELVIDVLTVMRAYITAGRPCSGELKPMGGFEPWNQVREALVWLGEPDPARCQSRLAQLDPIREQLGDIMSRWWNVFGDRPVRLDQAVRELREATTGDALQLHDALAGICPGDRINTRRLGWWFRKNSDRLIGDLRFIRSTDPKRGATIRLDRIKRQRQLDLGADDDSTRLISNQ